MSRLSGVVAAVALASFVFGSPSTANAQDATTTQDAVAQQTAPSSPAPQAQPAAYILTCNSEPGKRTECAADTSAGVTLLRSTGDAACLLGKTWGFDATGVWVSDGCSGAFAVKGPAASSTSAPITPRHVPNVGFLIFDGEKGQVYLRFFTYARYLNQRNLDDSYVDAFGNTHTVQRRQDVQLQKFFLPLSGWFLTPKMRYYLYVWSANTSQGDPAQVVGAGNISWVFNRFVTVGAGITSLPSVRSTEGQFPYWLGVDDRLIADEYFRGSYTSGFWFKGEINTQLKYMAMFANNLSTLGVSASQLDNKFDTQSYSLQWLPSTGEFGPWGGFGDFEGHEKLATRVGVHYTHSLEDKQSQPGTETIENSQIRLADGSNIFTANLFGPGITVESAQYHMSSVDAGLKYKGLAVEGEYYWRWLNGYSGPNVAGVPDISDHGYQMQTSAMPIPKMLQGYFSWSQIFGGPYGNDHEVRGGANFFPMKQRGIRVNTELMYVNRSPVGYTAYPYPVGAKGPVFHVNFEMNF
jgi:hypothetical protein